MSTVLLVLALAVAPQSAPGVDDQKVQEAIRRGIEFLRGAPSHGETKKSIRSADELLLLTFLHAGVPAEDPKVQELLKKILAGPLDRTYSVALQAVCLEELGRVRYQPRLQQCAQFLVDNQCTNGQWSYGEPSPQAAGPRVEDPRAAPPPPPGPDGRRSKPKVERKVPVVQSRTGPATGDNSNSQYAALGLRACHDAGITLPPEVIALAVKALRQGQLPKDPKAVTPKGVPAGSSPRGWCYCSPAAHKAYFSMTGGAVAALAMYNHILKRDWRKDNSVKDGLAWLAANFSVTENVGPMEWECLPVNELYYGLYAMERAARLFGTEKIGDHFWYAEGVQALLVDQAPNGSWSEKPIEKAWSTATWDTCFAILFLRRATQPLVPSEDRFIPPK